MNPYGDSYPNSHPSGVAPSCSQPPPLELASDASYDPSDDPSPPVIQTDCSSVIISHQASSAHAGCQDLVRSPSTALQLPASNPDFSVGCSPQSALALVSSPELAFTENPYPLPGSSYQVSVIVPSSDLHPFALPAECSEETCPDLECAICFSQFNNVFRCPKMLQCKHTFCLECLARINVKSTEPSAIQCPLCRSFTPLPTLGLPKLATDSNVLSYLPAAMQRVYSIRFLRSKGKLQVKRSTEGQRRWPRQSLTSLRSINPSLDVGVPSSAPEGLGESGRASGSLFRLTGQPVCRAFLLISVVLMMMLLMGIIVFILTFNKSQRLSCGTAAECCPHGDRNSG